MEPSLDNWTIIFAVVIVHGFILAGILFTRKKGRKLPNIFLGSLLLLFSLNILNYLAFWTRYNLEFPHIMGLAATFQFLYGPLLFFYVLSVLKPDKEWSKWEFLHFLPFLIYFLYLTPVYLQTSAQKAAILQETMQSTFQLSDTARIVAGLKTLHMSIYAGMIFNLQSLSDVFNIFFQGIKPLKRTWINIIKYSFLGFIFCYALFFILVDLIGYGLEYDYIISIAMSVFIFIIGYVGLAKPEYLQEAHKKPKYSNSLLDEKKAKQYLEHLLNYMKEQKAYRDGDLRLEDLADKLNIPRHYLSQIINDKLGKNYFEFINSYRIDEAKEILSDPGKEDHILLRVAMDVGFNNKTTFNTAFKKQEGITPSAYRKKHLKE